MRRLAYSSKFKQKCMSALTLAILTGCASVERSPDDVTNPDGTVGPGAPIAPPPGGDTQRKERQAVDSMLGQIPQGNDDEVSVPIEAIPGFERRSTEEERRRQFNAQKTDNEIVGSTGAADERNAQQLGDIDRALGVEPLENGGQAPSYTLGLQTLKDLYKEKKFEDALISVNDLLRWYPKSAQLLMMKGTLHQRLGQIDLSLSAYQRAFEFEPSRKLKAQIDHVQRLVNEREQLRRQREGVVAPGGDAEIKTVPNIRNGEN